MLKNTLVVNLFGEPSVGKSTAAAYIFSKLKMRGINCEYVTEFTKDKIWENNSEVFKNQAYIFGKQTFKLSRVVGKVDVVITDSPIFLSAVYNKTEVLGEDFNKVVANVFNSYNNFNILLKRKHDYQNTGRNETEDEADKIRSHLISKLEEYDIHWVGGTSDIETYDVIIDIITAKVNAESKEVN